MVQLIKILVFLLNSNANERPPHYINKKVTEQTMYDLWLKGTAS